MCKPTYEQIDKLVRKGKKFRCLALINIDKDLNLDFQSCEDIDDMIKKLKQSREDLRDTL